MQKRVESGLWPGGGCVPFGYDYDPEQGILVPNQDAATVKKAYDLFLQGYSTYRIAEMLNLKYDRLAYQILTRKSNAGYIVYNGAEYRGKHEPIISLETYERTMMMMKDRSDRHYVSSSVHLLTGLVRCGVCGAKMRYAKWGKQGYKLVCYSQQTSKKYLVRDENAMFAESLRSLLLQAGAIAAGIIVTTSVMTNFFAIYYKVKNNRK